MSEPHRAPTIDLAQPIGPQIIAGLPEVYVIALSIDELQHQIDTDPSGTWVDSASLRKLHSLRLHQLRRRRLDLTIRWRTFSLEDQTAALAWLREYHRKALR